MIPRGVRNTYATHSLAKKRMSETTVHIPAIGKIVELGDLDDFIWATLRGWGILPARSFLRSARGGEDLAAMAKEMAIDIKEEERELRLLQFADAEASKDYPYLFSLVAVRLWAMVESAARGFALAAVKQSRPLPAKDALRKLKGPIAPLLGAGPEVQAEIVVEALWHSVEGQWSGVGRFEAVLQKLGFPGALHGTVREVLTELSEVRHCVIHRDARVDERMLSACPWISERRGDAVPATMQNYWLYRTATYSYIMDLVRSWADWQGIEVFVTVCNEMEAIALQELRPAWSARKRAR